MRDQVQRWLSACIVAGHDTPDGDNSHVSFDVSAPTLEALCRAWLALDGGLPGVVDSILYDDGGKRSATTIHHIESKGFPIFRGSGRVRIVPDQGEGE